MFLFYNFLFSFSSYFRKIHTLIPQAFSQDKILKHALYAPTDSDTSNISGHLLTCFLFYSLVAITLMLAIF